MTFCGELRLDGRPASPSLAATMLAASVTPTGDHTPGHDGQHDGDQYGGDRHGGDRHGVAARGPRTHAAGPFAVATAAGPALGPEPDLAHGPGGLLAVVDGWSPPAARPGLPARGGPVPADVGGPGRGRVSGRLVAAYGRRGVVCLDDLLGDWVLGVFDPASGRLVLARAPQSMRRLVVHQTADRLLFGTEPSQLRAAGIPLDVDETILAETLTRDLTTPHETLLRGVERVPAGYLFEITPGERPTRRPFTSLLSITPPLRPTPLRDAADALRGALEAAVHDATPDGAVGVGLSGGVDSSTIAGLVRRLPARDGAPIRIVPISMVFPGRPHDESRWIDAVEEHLGLPVLRVKPGAYDWDHWRAWTARTLDTPPRPNLALATSVREAAAAEGLSVLLSGEGGDDWFTGWRSHWPDLRHAGHLSTLWRQTGAGISPRSLRTRLTAARRHALAPFPRGIAGDRLVLPWIRPERIRHLDLEGRFARADAADAAMFASCDQRERWRLAVVRSATPLLDTARSFYAAAGLDWRHPFHDRRVVEAALRTPGATLYVPGVPKPVLRAAVGDVLPEVVRTRRTKAHFDLELVDAVEAAGGMAMLAGGPLVSDGWIDLDVVTRAWTVAAGAARAGEIPPEPEHGLVALWQLIGLDMWLARSGVHL